MLFFAARRPETPDKLTAHAFSYAHMELAAYELLKLTAEQAGDVETARMASEIAAGEQRMADRLEASFEVAVEASLRAGDGPSDTQLDRYLADTHAIEQQALQLLEAAPDLVRDEELKQIFSQHLEKTKGHEQLIRERLQARGAKPPQTGTALRIGDLDVGAFFAGQPDVTAKITSFAFAFVHLEIAEERVARNKLARSWHLAASPRHA